MLRVVLDTNVFVSGLRVKRSKPAQIVDLWREERFQLIVSDAVFEEYLVVLSQPVLKIDLADVRAVMQYVYLKAEFIHPGQRIHVVKDDPSDDKFIECAAAAKADFIVSGDKHLLALGEFGDIKIVSVAEFLESMSR